MEDLHFEETGNLPLTNSMHQHLQTKLGKPSDIQKTPSRIGLGMIVNESKTPGARSLQSIASARKVNPSAVKATIPTNIGFEIFEDDVDDELIEKSQPAKQEIEERPCSPIDTVNRCASFDSLAADIADDLLNMSDQDVVLFDEKPLGDYTDRRAAEVEELAALGIEEWEDYPPIDPASRISDDSNDIFTLDDFHHEGDVKLEEANYGIVHEDVEILKMVSDDWKTIAEHLLNMTDDLDDLLAKEATPV